MRFAAFCRSLLAGDVPRGRGILPRHRSTRLEASSTIRLRAGAYTTLLALCAVMFAAAAHAGPNIDRAAAVRFEPGQRPPFLGFFSCTEPNYGLPDTTKFIEHVIANNPLIAGFTVRLQWRVLHPERGRIEWEQLEKLIATAAAADKLITISLLPGGASPPWIYEAGALKAGPTRNGARIITTPVPWDPTFMELFTKDLAAIAERYGNDPRLFGMTVLGQNFNYLGEEMHAPSVDAFLPFGWTEERVLENWRYWIDTYAWLFPTKKLMVVPSQSYRGADHLSRKIVAYFAEKCAGRGFLQTHQLTGRGENVAFGPQICREFGHVLPATHEIFSSMKYIAWRTGSLDMWVFNANKIAPVPFLQMWARDAEDPEIALRLKEAWENYGAVPPAEAEARLRREGKYVVSTPYLGAGYTPHDLSRLPPPGYPGHDDPKIRDWSPMR